MKLNLEIEIKDDESDAPVHLPYLAKKSFEKMTIFVNNFVIINY